jgi:hypothetical protein
VTRRHDDAKVALIAAVGVTSLVVVLVLVVAVFGRESATHAQPHVISPPVTGAFATGGVPRPDPDLERVLADDLPRLVMAVDRARYHGAKYPRPVAQLAAISREPALAAHGPALAVAWRELIDVLDRWVSVPASKYDHIAADLRGKVRAVSDQLATVGVGYYLDGDVFTRGSHGTARAIIYSYRVEDVVYVNANSVPRRVLSLRRIDRLESARNLLGMQSEDLGDPVVLLDQVDLHVIRRILPVLAPRAPYPLVRVDDREDDAWPETPIARQLAQRAGASVRREVLAVLGDDAVDAKAVGDTLLERAKILDRWRDDLAKKGVKLGHTSQLFLPENMLAAVADRVDAGEYDRVRDLEIALGLAAAPHVASRCRELVTASVRRHEAQHGVDSGRGEPLAYPSQLEELLGPPLDGNGAPRRPVERARAELSAYLSQIANDPVTPHMALWNLAHHAFTASMAGTPEAIAGALILEGLARHRGIKATEPVIQPLTLAIDRTRLAEIAVPLARLSDDQIRWLARRLWDELYDEPLTTIVD